MTLLPSDKALVPFVSVANMMKLIHRIGLCECLIQLTDVLERDFLRWPEFDKTPRVAAHSRDGVIELMPTSDGVQYAFKYVNGHPVNTKAGLQTVSGFGLLADVATGYPMMLSEMTLLTALRTAATSAVATRALMPKEARVHAMIGNGAQSEFQALAQSAVNSLVEVRLYDTDAAATARCARNLRAAGLSVVECGSAEEAVLGADVITTCTADKQYATILTDNMVGSGVHVNAIGGDCPGKTELHRDILLRSDIFVEYPEQTRLEGELQQLDAEHPVTELWRVLDGQVPGRTDARQITLFDGVGFATEDFSALCWLNEALSGSDCFEMLDIVADPDEPRDLYGMLMRSA